MPLMGPESHLTSAPSFPPVRHNSCDPSTGIKGMHRKSPQHRHQQPPDPSWDPHLELLPHQCPREIQMVRKKPWKMELHVLQQEVGQIQKSPVPSIKREDGEKFLPGKARKLK